MIQEKFQILWMHQMPTTATAPTKTLVKQPNHHWCPYRLTRKSLEGKVFVVTHIALNLEKYQK